MYNQNTWRTAVWRCPNYFDSFSHGFFLKWFVSFIFFDQELKAVMSKLLWFFVVLSALVMVDQTKGWRRRRCYARSCVVGTWGLWSYCSKSCGWGQRTRSRTMLRYATCGRSCPYVTYETGSCNTFRCPSKEFEGALSLHCLFLLTLKT